MQKVSRGCLGLLTHNMGYHSVISVKSSPSRWFVLLREGLLWFQWWHFKTGLQQQHSRSVHVPDHCRYKPWRYWAMLLIAFVLSPSTHWQQACWILCVVYKLQKNPRRAVNTYTWPSEAWLVTTRSFLVQSTSCTWTLCEASKQVCFGRAGLSGPHN